MSPEVVGRVVKHELGHIKSPVQRKKYGDPDYIKNYLLDELAADYFALSFDPNDSLRRRTIQRRKVEARDVWELPEEEIRVIEAEAIKISGYEGVSVK